MESKNNLKGNLEKGDYNKKKIIIFAALGIILLFIICFFVIKNILYNNKDSKLIDNNKDNGIYSINDNNKLILYNVDNGVVG